MYKKILSLILLFISHAIYAEEVHAAAVSVAAKLSEQLSGNLVIGSAVAGDSVQPTKLLARSVSGSSYSDADLVTNSERDIIALRNGDKAILLAHSFSDTNKVELSANSTATSLILLHPSLLGLTAPQQQNLISVIKTLNSFGALTKRVQKMVTIDPDTPLDYFVHPFLQLDVDSVVTELITTSEFKLIVDHQTLDSYVSNRLQARTVDVRGFSVACKDSSDKELASCSEADKLTITNPKAVYYSAFIDKNKSDILDAKEGLINVEFGLYPPKFDINSSQSTDFSLDRFNSSGDTYNINLTRELGWNPLTPEGSATWMNGIKGLSLLVELAGFAPTDSRSSLLNFISTNSTKLATISNDFLDKNKARAGILLTTIFTEIVGQYYDSLPVNTPQRESIGEVYYTLKKLTKLGDKMIGLIGLDPIQSEEVFAQLDATVKVFFQHESLTELLSVVTTEDSVSVVYESIRTKILVEARAGFSLAIMNSDIPFSYDFAMQKMAGFFTALETEGVFDALLGVLLNDVVNETAKAVSNIVLNNMFGLPYKVAVTGNKLVPYVWDMTMAPETLKFPVYQGQLKYLEEPKVTTFNIKRDGEKIYDYSAAVASSQEYVQVNPNECLDFTYYISMPGNFDRGISATDELWTWLADYPEVSNFKATLSGRYETSQGSKKYTRQKLLEKELQVFTQRDWGIRSNGWKLNWYYDGKYSSLELDDDPLNWSTDQFGFKLDKVIEQSTQLCFEGLDSIPDQFFLNYNNFNYESIGSFLVNVRKPNTSPQIASFSAKPDVEDNLHYLFDNFDFLDDYTRVEDLKLEVDYGDGQTGVITGSALFAFSHKYEIEGTYEMSLVAIDEDGARSDVLTVINYPGLAYPNLTLSKEYIDFNEVELGGQVSQRVIVRNTGFAPLGISNISLVAGVFQITSNNCDDQILEAQSFCSIVISFNPIEQNAWTESLSIKTDSANNQTSLITLKGEGVLGSGYISNFERVFEPYQVTDVNGNKTTVSTYTPSGNIYGNVELKAGTLDLKGQTLIIYGHLIHSGGVLNINGGSLEVKGDYRIQASSISFSAGYTYSTGFLKMLKTADRVTVSGDFVMDSYYSHEGYLTAGQMNFKGDFTQLATGTYGYNNFAASSGHKVILSGKAKQLIHFSRPDYSHFDKLHITNQSGQTQFNELAVNELTYSGDTLKLPSFKIKRWPFKLASDMAITLPEDQFAELSGESLTLSGHKLTIDGSLLQSAGTLDVDDGQLVVTEDYRIQSSSSTGYGYSTGFLKMLKTADRVTVSGDFVMDSYYSHEGYLTAGQMNFKGDFTQLATGTYGYNNFAASSGHKVILSGKAKQLIHFSRPDYSHFDKLHITNQSGQTQFNELAVNELTYSGDTLKLPSFKIKRWPFKLASDMAITLPEDQFAELSGESLTLSGHKLTIDGSLLQSAGTLDVDDGQLVVTEDYRIQSSSSTGYGYSTGFLKMLKTADRVTVSGDFVMDSYYSHEGYLTAGQMNFKGDFTQLATGTYGYNNFAASSGHKVILSGKAKQLIHFSRPDYSHFDKLHITNQSGQTQFNELAVNELTYSGDTLKLPSFKIKRWPFKLASDMAITLPEDQFAELSGESLTLNGHKLTIDGSLLQSAGTLDIDGGQLVVTEDYRIQSSSSTGYTYSTGFLKMLKTTDRVMVSGDFVMDSYYSHEGYLTAGQMNFKGDFTQLATGIYGYNNFAVSSGHKVILSGKAKQLIHFNRPDYSHFDKLHITNQSGQTQFNELAVNELTYSGDTLKLPSFKIKRWPFKLASDMAITLPEDQFAELSGESLTLNGHKLTIDGSLLQSAGTLDIDGGQLVVTEDYRIQSSSSTGYGYSTGFLKMLKTADRVTVSGDFVMDSYYSHEGYLTAGQLNLKGGFTQLATGTYGYNNFSASSGHKVILSGEAKQLIHFSRPDYSRFATLIITNTSLLGVDLTSSVRVTQLFEHRRNPFTLAEANVGTNFPDYDGDGVRDHLDPSPQNANIAYLDKDGDGINDDKDAFPDDATEWIDNDSDGIGNNADTDDDNDGISDAWELANGLNPLDSSDAANDADGDNVINLDEYRASTDPQNSDSDGDGIMDGQDTVVGTGLWGYACNVVNDPNSSTRRWGINQFNLANMPNAVTEQVYSMGQNRKIQSVACDPSGDNILFSMKDSLRGDYEIYELDVANDSVIQITDNDTDDVDVTSSRDGRTVAWQKRLGDNRQAIELRRTSESGGYTYKTLASASPFVQPSLSPNGDWLAFVQLRPSFFAVMRYDIANNKYKEVQSIVRRKKLYHPSITDDGNKVGWTERLSLRRYRVKDITENTTVDILNDANGIQHAVLSGDGQHVIYSINTADITETYLTALETLDTQVVGETLNTPMRHLSTSWTGVTASTGLTDELVSEQQFTSYTQGETFHFNANNTGTLYPIGTDEAVDFTWTIQNGALLITESISLAVWSMRLLAQSQSQYTLSVTGPDEQGGIKRLIETYQVD